MTTDYGLSPKTKKAYERELLRCLKADIILNKFLDGKIVKTTWKERISDLLHFRWPGRTKFVMDKSLSENKGGTIKFRRLPPLENSMVDMVKSNSGIKTVYPPYIVYHHEDYLKE